MSVNVQTPSDKMQKKFDRFESWLIANGARFDQLELRAYECDIPHPNDDIDECGEEKKEHNNTMGGNDTAAATTTMENMESEMRGVHAKRRLPNNTVCMIIPRRCLITVEMGQATKIGQAILQSDLDLDAPKHIFLMIFILWDRKMNGSNSFFHPYYEILPTTLHNMPIFWTPEELEELQASYLLQQIADRNQAITDDYNAICEIAPSLRQIATLDEFKWARMCVCSRNFGLQIDGHRTSAMVPHADMLNHYRPRETKWTFDEDRQAFTITTLQNISAGSEVFDSYGQKCNHRFLLNYGFAVEDNREMDGFCPNEVPLTLTVPANDPCFAEKLKFWIRGENQIASLSKLLTQYSAEQVATHTLKRVRVCVSNNENTRLLFSLVRALSCNAEELRAVSTNPSNLAPSSANRMATSTTLPRSVVLTGSPAPIGATYHRSCRDIRHPVSLRNEIQAMRLLLDLVQQHLDRYSTTLQEDVAALQDLQSYPKFSNRRHAKIQVRGEKEVLVHYASWAIQALDILDTIASDLRLEEDQISMTESGNGIEVLYGQPPQQNLSQSQHCAPVLSFDIKVLQMEHDPNAHHTIVRFCADVLGSLRREELKNLRRRLKANHTTRPSTNASSTETRSPVNGKSHHSQMGSELL